MTKRPATPLCDYCGREAAFLPSSAELYQGRDYGPAWACLPCGAWVGCHPDDRPLGRLADKTLRTAKQAAHAAFDPLWRARMARDGLTQGKARGKGYKWLAAQMGLTRQECHIGMFDVAQCQRVVAICEPFARKLRA